MPVRVALRSSRRAATSSSTTSGDPADRSATRTTIDADGRSPSMPSMSPAISRRARGARSTRTGGRRPASITARFSRSWCSPASRSGWYVSTRQIRSSRAIRATNVAKARVAASAAWRSSSAMTIGRSAATRPSQRSSASSARGWRRSGSARSLARGPGTVSARSATPGRPRRMGRASRARSASVSATGRSASSGPIASSTAAHGGSIGPWAWPRSTSGGCGRAPRRSIASSRNRDAPIPALPATMTVVAVPAAAALTASTTRASSDSRPMYRRLTTRPGMGGIVGARTRLPGRVPPRARRPPRPRPAGTLPG